MNKKGNAVLIIVVIVVIILVAVGAFVLLNKNKQSENEAQNTVQQGYELYENANNVAKDVAKEIDSVAAKSYNARYELYFRKNSSLSDLKALINQVNTHNANELEADRGKINLIGYVINDDNSSVEIFDGDAENHNYSVNENAKTSLFYEITCDEYNDEGYIKTIKVVATKSRV